MFDDFEEFILGAVRRRGFYIAIHKANTLIFSAEFVINANLIDWTCVSLAYSRSRHAILFNFSKEMKENFYKILAPQRSTIHTRNLGALTYFFNRFGIQNAEGKYSPILEDFGEPGKKWVIYLDKKII